jgi:hypothetical protein
MRCSVQVWFGGAEVYVSRTRGEELELGEFGECGSAGGVCRWRAQLGELCCEQLPFGRYAGAEFWSGADVARMSGGSFQDVNVSWLRVSFFVWLHIGHLFSAYSLRLACVHFMLQDFILVISFVLNIHLCSWRV